jgi:hypothetical protein
MLWFLGNAHEAVEMEDNETGVLNNFEESCYSLFQGITLAFVWRCRKP